MSKGGVTVSVVMALYNAETYVRDTLLSVLRQTHKSLDIIVVDDCSKDHSADIVKELMIQDERITLLQTDTNSGGPSRPRNMGISHSRGEYIAFVDADDLWETNKIEKQLAGLSAGMVLSFTDNQVIDANSSVLRYRMSHVVRFFRKMIVRFGLRFLLLSNQIVLSSVLLKKTALAETRFDEDRFMQAVEDYGLWLKIAYQFPKGLTYVDAPLTSYRRHALGISSNRILGRLKGTYCVTRFYLSEKKPVYPLWGGGGCILRLGKSILEYLLARVSK